MDDSTTLYRPVGKGELDLIRESGYKRFPPRLSHQPIFYPVLSEEYAREIAEKWNTRDEKSGYAGFVTKFRLKTKFVQQFAMKQVGDTQHRELWIPAASLEDMNHNLVGKIEVIAEFFGRWRCEICRTTNISKSFYRGRLAPSPTGLLHVGHARTFWIAAQRAIENQGTLILRNEDLDPQRSRAEFVRAMMEDLRWLGIHWSEGPDGGGPYGPYSQNERRAHYLEAWRRLRQGGFLYPCICSRKDLAQSASAPNDADDELMYPGTCRDRKDVSEFREPAGVNWRFRVPDGEAVEFADLNLGRQRYVAGSNFDFGDFLVWRRDDVPAYQLAVVVDDRAMRITEVVRGADLLKSTARQLLLRRALGYADLGNAAPEYFHCELVRDAAGVRLAKRHDALSIRHLRESGMTAEKVLEMARWP